MTDHLWIGGATAVAQVDTVTIPDDVVAGLVFKATINSKTLSYTIPADTSAAAIAAAIVDDWNASEVAEFNEVLATDNGDGTFTLSSVEAGQPFVVAITIGDGTNEIQTVTIGGSPTGGTFTLSVGGQTTSPLAYNATGATVEAALEALSTVGSGNVTVTGDGPYTIEFIGTLAGVNMAPIGSNADGLTVPPEVQEVDLGSPTGGTFTAKLGAAGTSTSALAYNISAASYQTALEGLPEIGSGNVSVSGSAGGPFTITFQGAFNGLDVTDLIIDGSSLTGGLADSVTITEQTAGGGGGNEQWTIWGAGSGLDGVVRINGNASVSGGTFDIEIDLNGSALVTVANIPYDVTPSELQTLLDTALNSGPAAQKKMMIVHGYGATKLDAGSQLSAGDNFTITVPLIFGEEITNHTALTVDSTNLTGGTYGDDDLQSNTYSGSDQGYGTGSWAIVVDGEQSADLANDISAADLQTALENLTAIGSGNVAVVAIGAGTLGDGGGWRITFQGDLANQATGLSIYAINLAGSGHTFGLQINWEGDPGTAEVQRITISGSPTSGQFGLIYAGGYSAAIPWDTTASELEAILEAVDTIGTGNVACSGGPFPGSYIDVTFQGGLSGSNLAEMTVTQGTFSTTTDGGNPATITVATVQVPVDHETTTDASGPNDWNTAGNWDTVTIPTTGDTVFILDGDSIWYGLDQSAVSLARLKIYNYDVQIGLARRTDDYFEYRQTHLILGGSPDIVIGLGSAGSGSNRIFLDIQDGSPSIEIHDSGSGEDDAPAVQIIGENTIGTAELLILGGDVGLAVFPKQAGYFNKITQRAGSLSIGHDVTVMEMIKTGGDVKMNRTTIDGLATQ